jgi:hypothetical protein
MEANEALRLAVSAYVVSKLGAGPGAGQNSRPDEEGLAELSVRAAQLFLNNCSDKTVKVLSYIVSKNGDFRAAELYRHMKVKNLRGVWTGLTRRVRSVTKDDCALLINWVYKPGEQDYRGVMAAATVDSLRIALAERG